MKYTLRPYQKQAADAAVAAFAKGKSNGILVLPTGCHAKGTKVLMYDGTMKCVEDVHIGDLLMGIDNKPRKVIELHSGTDEMFEIQPKVGDSFIVNKGHILSLYKTKEGDYPSEQPRIDEISVGDYLKKTKWYKHIHKLHKPSQIDFGHVNGSVGEPYLLGLYLGDGSSVNGCYCITTMRDEVAEYLEDFCEKCGYSLRISEKSVSNKAKSYYITDHGKKNKPNPVLDWLRDLGVFKLTAGDKHIPHQYKTASVRDRYELLAGLLDTDAWYDDEKCSYEYCTKSLVMAKDIQFLCRSLGFMCNIGKPKVVNGLNYYRMQISGDLEKIPTKVAIRQARARKMKKSVLVTGFDVKSIGIGEYYGFTLDGDHLYMDEQFFIHHNSGKSLIIGDIAARLDSPLLVFNPTQEILKQNYEKICSYDILDVGLYSASVNRKDIRRITLATIGSVKNHPEDFRLFKYVLVDECHGVSSKDGTMYKDFLESRDDRVVVGLTASPYRLERGAYGSILKFLTRTRPRVFGKVLYVCQTGDLLRNGYISPVQYFDVTDKISFDLRRVKVNSTGADYDEDSLKEEYKRSDFMTDLVNWTLRVLRPNDGSRRKGVLVFTRFVRESEFLVDCLRKKGVTAVVVSGDTPKRERDQIVADFKAGCIQVLANANVFSMGFDYPALDTVIIAHPTRSLARWYQQIGRVVRLSPGKTAWVLDLCGNYKRFGGFEDLKIECPLGSSRWVVTSKGRQLTGVTLQ